MKPRLILLACALALLAAAAWYLRGHGDDPMLALLDALPAEVPVAAPTTPIVNLELSENLSEEVSHALDGLGEAFRKRDWNAAASLCTGAFRGADLSAWTLAPAPARSAGIEHFAGTAPKPAAVAAPQFFAGLQQLLAEFSDVDYAAVRLDRADFQAGQPLWGRVRVVAEWSGFAADHTARWLVVHGFAKVAQAGKQWYVHAFEATGVDSYRRARRMFTDVTRAAGVYCKDRPRERHKESWNGSACGDVDGDGLLDLYVTGTERNFLYLGRAEGGFVDAADSWGVQKPAGGTGSVFFDYDGDGDLDLLVADEAWVDRTGETHNNELTLFRNESSAGAKRFTNVTKEAGLAQRRYSESITVLDYDGDGRLDFFLANYGRQTEQHNNLWVSADNGQSNQLFRNVDGKRFEDVSEKAGVTDKRWTYASAAVDFDHDGDTDLYVVNDFGPNTMLRNEGNGTFSEVKDPVLTDPGFGMSATFADFNNDGFLDLYVSNMGCEVADRILARVTLKGPEVDVVRKFGRGNSLILGRKDGGYDLAPVEFGATEGRWAWGSPPLDVDLDGRLDIFCTNGFMSGPAPGDAITWYWRNVVASSIPAENEPSILVRQEVSDPVLNKNLRDTVWREHGSYAGHERDKLWVNEGASGFFDASPLSGVDLPDDGRAAIVADFDDDGDPDLFVNSVELERHHLFRNDATDPAGRFLKVELAATKRERHAIGAEVIVHGPCGPCSQIVACGSQFLTCQPAELLFGLGTAQEARVEVFWPGGAREDFGLVRAGSRVRLVEGSGKAEYGTLRTHPLTR